MKPPKQHQLSGCDFSRVKSSGCALPPSNGVRQVSKSFANVPTREVRYFLNSYHPLCESEQGSEISRQHNIAPFVDYSIRREPDFECRFPSVTGLCRCNKLVGQVQEGDFIAYVTVKSAGPRRLVALLQVLHKLPNHAVAADWYWRKRLNLPTNCVVPGNGALPLNLAVQPTNMTTYAEWKSAYQWRSENYPTFLICRAAGGPELTNPPFIPETVFGRAFPNTRSPKQLIKAEFEKLRRLLP